MLHGGDVMHVAVMYSGVGGPNGADYVAEMLANGFRDAGVRVSMIGNHGEYDLAKIAVPDGADFIVHSSGFNLTPESVATLRQTAPLFLWTFTDEIDWWRNRIAPVSGLVDIHYSYSRKSGFGDHVRYLPLAADPTMYYPNRSTYDEAWRDVDVCMIGAALAVRFPKSYFSWAMCIPVEHIRALYARTKVVIAPVQDCDEDVPGRAWGCPCRTFDVRACRAYQLEVYREGIADAYPAVDTVASIPDVAKAAQAWGDLIQAMLADPKAREAVAHEDYMHTLSYHLYRHRAEKMVLDFKAMGKG
jgi:hypothetical protein